MGRSGGPFDVIVIGGGLNGLATVHHLHRLGVKRVGLVEQFRLGNLWGSSHGQSRITRSTYPERRYVRLMGPARDEEWPRVETDIGRPLIHPVDGCFFGPPGPELDRYVEAVGDADVDLMDVAQARRRFPQFRFDGVRDVLHDRTSGLIAAAEAMTALVTLARRTGARIMEETKVTGLRTTGGRVVLLTDRGELEAERVVLTAGPWTGRLLPFLAPRLTVIRQTIAYLELDAPAEALGPDRFPVWASIAPGDRGFRYGLPEFGRPGVKVALHVTKGMASDPDVTPDEDDSDAVEEVRAFAERIFSHEVTGVAGSETCLYTCTPTEDFVLDRHPDDPRITIGAGFSGHGFKFGPLTGRILAELSVNGSTTVREFEEERRWFSATRPAEETRSG